MNCDECEDKLERFVDRELSDAEVAELRRHLHECPPCEDRYRFQAEFKRLIRVSCCQPESNAPESLRAKLREILF
jgi:mycothiol system anti-sigma-R factor